MNSEQARVNLYAATKQFRNQFCKEQMREPEPSDYFRAGANWEAMVGISAAGKEEDNGN